MSRQSQLDRENLPYQTPGKAPHRIAVLALAPSNTSAPPLTPLGAPPTRLPPLPHPPDGDGALPVVRGLAAGLGLWIGYKLPDWLDKLRNGRQSFAANETSDHCDQRDLAASYLENLRRNGIDGAVRAIPPRNFEWSLPSRHTVRASQSWGKDGVVVAVSVMGPDGATRKLRELRVKSAELTAKGVKLQLAEIPWNVAGENFGTFIVDLRMGSRGLNEIQLRFRAQSGNETTWKLKPKPCDLDLSSGGLLKINEGSQSEARKWVNLHLARAARMHGGDISPGLFDLLLEIRSTAVGVYRNHGSPALDVLTRALNALSSARVDMNTLTDLQARGAASATGPHRSNLSRQAAQWLRTSLSMAIREGRIDPSDLRNSFEINFGVRALANVPKELPKSESPVKRVAQGQLVEVHWRDVVRSVAPSEVVQTRDGRLFIAMNSNSEPYFKARLERLASALGVESRQLSVFPAYLTIGGVKTGGVVIDARRFQ